MAEYADAAKKLLSVCTRLQHMFRGARYYETVQAETADGILFRWDYRYGKFEWHDPERGWLKAVNPRNPSMMARLISVTPHLHRAAVEKKAAVADALEAAAEAGEQYLQEMSGLEDIGFAEEETSDHEEAPGRVVEH
jgi:hypothetical protein